MKYKEYKKLTKQEKEMYDFGERKTSFIFSCLSKQSIIFLILGGMGMMFNIPGPVFVAFLAFFVTMIYSVFVLGKFESFWKKYMREHYE